MIEAKYANLCHICNNWLETKEVIRRRCRIKNKSLCYFEGEDRVKKFLDFFEKAIGKPRALQKFWAKRALKGESFAAVAPTGIGKSTFGIALALFLAGEGKKSYLIFPTTLLVQQALEIVEKIEEALQRIEEGTYGKCQSCGNEIPLSRLRAIPYANLCKECKTKEEKSG